MKIYKQHISIFLYLFLFLLFWIALPLNLRAQDSLEKHLETAANNNPELKAIFYQYLASLEKVPQVGSLPDPQSTFGYFIKPMAIVGGSQVANIQIMQMFPWFGTLKIAKDEASAMANAKFELFNSEKAELFYKVKSNWYQLMKLDKEIQLTEENIELLESLEKLVLVKFQSPTFSSNPSSMKASSGTNSSSMSSMNTNASGMNSMQSNANASIPKVANNSQSESMPSNMNSTSNGLQDVLRVKMEILEQKNKLFLLRDQRITSETSFNALLNRDLIIQIKISDAMIAKPLDVSRLAIADSILKNNPMLAMLENEISSYALMEEKAKKMGYPMLGAGLSYNLNKKREDNTFMMNGNDMLMPMFTMSIPIYRKKNNAMQNEARLMQAAGIQQLKSLKNSLLVEYRSLIQNIDDAQRRIDLYNEQEELARKTTDLLLASFSTTGTNYEEVLRMQYKVLDYGFKYIEAITDYNTSVALAEKLMNSLNK